MVILVVELSVVPVPGYCYWSGRQFAPVMDESGCGRRAGVAVVAEGMCLSRSGSKHAGTCHPVLKRWVGEICQGQENEKINNECLFV